MKPDHPFHAALFAVVLSLPLLTACQEKPYMLGISGYNYTDRYIDTFSVNSQGGSNIELSDDESGGGKETCCISLQRNQSLPVLIRVEWTYGYKLDRKTGEIAVPDESHSAEVELKGPIPKDPHVFLAHFYPDNTVQVEVVSDYPPPRIKRKQKEPA